MTRISVLMSTYNEPIEWVSETLDSLINQTYKPFEVIIIVDNPDNKEMVDFLLSRQEGNELFKVHINEKNMGLVASLNRGLKYCSGDLIARIDADDIAIKERFELQLKAIESEGLDLVGTGFHTFYDDKIIATWYGVESAKACAKILNYSNIVQHPTWMMKKEVPLKLGGYRDIDSCEDLDFLHRAVKAGFRVANVKEPLLMYRDNPQSISHKKRTAQLLTRDYLCAGYRRNKVTSYEDYKKYIESEKFKIDSEKVAVYDEIYRKNNAKLSVELIKKGGLWYFLHLKCKNAYVNWWRSR